MKEEESSAKKKLWSYQLLVSLVDHLAYISVPINFTATYTSNSITKSKNRVHIFTCPHTLPVYDYYRYCSLNWNCRRALIAWKKIHTHSEITHILAIKSHSNWFRFVHIQLIPIKCCQLNEYRFDLSIENWFDCEYGRDRLIARVIMCMNFTKYWSETIFFRENSNNGNRSR